jgi:hypothetical protein
MKLNKLTHTIFFSNRHPCNGLGHLFANNPLIQIADVGAKCCHEINEWKDEGKDLVVFLGEKHPVVAIALLNARLKA